MKTFRIFLSALTIISCSLLAACSGDEPALKDDVRNAVKKGELVQGNVDLEVLSRYAAAIEPATYTRTDYALYNKDSQSKGKWELIEEMMLGGDAVAPGRLIVNKGKMWKEIESFHCYSGPTAFATALWAVNKFRGTNYTVYAARNFEINPDNLTLTLNGTEFGLVAADQDKMILSHVSTYYGGRTHEGGEHLELSSYTKSEPLTFDNGKDLQFDSVIEAYDWLIEQFRDTFGESVDRNKLLAGVAILNEPMFYLSSLEAERDSLTK